MKTFNHQDNLYDFPYHYLPSTVDLIDFGGPARTRTWDQYIMSVLL